MKKISIFICIMLLFTISLFANDGEGGFMFNWNIGNLGFASNIPFRDGYSGELSISALHFSVESRYTNIGLEFNPLMIYFWPNISDDAYLSLLNLKAYWNVISYNGFFVGPFASANYIFIDDKLHWDSYVFTVGAHIGYKIMFKNVCYNIITGELGYRNINGVHRYHIGAKIDILSFLVFTSITDWLYW